MQEVSFNFTYVARFIDSFRLQHGDGAPGRFMMTVTEAMQNLRNNGKIVIASHGDETVNG